MKNKSQYVMAEAMPAPIPPYAGTPNFPKMKM